MAKSREKIQQIGFWDPEVSTPDHDKVVEWAYENADQIFRQFFPDLFDRSWIERELHFTQPWTDQSKAKLHEYMAQTPRPNPRASKRSWEYILKSYTGYRDLIERIVGYADLFIETEVPFIETEYIQNQYGDTSELEGFRLCWSSDKRYGAQNLLIEAKSVLPTLGELMRQVRLYATTTNATIVVVSPDDRYTKILNEQGIKFVQYPG